MYSALPVWEILVAAALIIDQLIYIKCHAVQIARKHSISIVIYNPIAAGLLSGILMLIQESL
jgi:aryl-alcohol dehydrogenase-like predicted oxidoreductase